MLTRPRDPVISRAIRIGSTWCAGRRVDGGVAFGHGVRVARVVDTFWPHAPAIWYATALVHDGPEFVDATEVTRVLTAELGDEVCRYVWGLWDEHEVYEVCDRQPELADTRVPQLATDTPALLRIMAADQVVSFVNLQRRLRRARDQGTAEADFWGVRENLLARMDYFRRFHTAARPHVPAAMFDHWGHHLALVPALGQPPSTGELNSSAGGERSN